ILAVPDYQSLLSLKDAGYYQLWGHDIVDPSSTEPAVAKVVSDLAAGGISGIDNINAGRVLDDYLAAAAIGAALKSCAVNCTRDGLATALANTQLNLPGVTSGSWGYSPTRHIPTSSFTAYKFD